jgi:hypothetical protein
MHYLLNDPVPEDPVLTLDQILDSHLESGISLVQNVFRYGSDSWCRLILLARERYRAGLLTELNEDDFAILESNTGEKRIFEGCSVLLDAPMIIHDRPGFYVVHTEADGVVTKIEFDSN